MIPKVLHRIWVGPELMPPSYRDYGYLWRDLHPDWEHREWTDENMPLDMRNRFLYNGATSWAQKADIARYSILLAQGGVYVDCDFEPQLPLDPYIEGVTGFAAMEDEHYMNIAIIGSEPQHRFLRQVVKHLPNSMRENAPATINVQSGPIFFTAEYQSYPHDDWTVYGPELFYPYHHTERHRRGEEFPDAVAIHHWGQNW